MARAASSGWATTRGEPQRLQEAGAGWAPPSMRLSVPQSRHKLLAGLPVSGATGAGSIGCANPLRLIGFFAISAVYRNESTKGTASRGPRNAMASVDMHFHWGPKGFADALRQRSVRPRIFRGDDG